MMEIKMAYSIIQPPFELKFREMPKKDLIAYRDWFHAVMPERMAELTKAVKATAGFEDWDADLTSDSLGPLGEWFRVEVETRKRTDAEMGELKSRLTFPIDVPNEELTNRTFSLAMDIGMYFGQVILKNLPGTRWDQPVRNPKFADHGQPVIMGFGAVPLNPVRIAVTLAYAFAAKEQSGGRLRALYDVWSKKRS
jgi:hypothetical protein